MSSYIAKRMPYRSTPYYGVRTRSAGLVRRNAGLKILGAYRTMKARRAAIDRLDDFLEREEGGRWSRGYQYFPRTARMRMPLHRAKTTYFRRQYARRVAAIPIQRLYRGYRVRKNLPRFKGV